MKSKKRVGKVIIYILLAVGTIVMVFPFIWSVLTSFKSLSESLQVPPSILPQKWEVTNYADVWEALPFVDFFLNTAVMILARIVIAVFLSAMAAYAFARMEFPLKNVLFLVVLLPMMVPAQIFILPQYLIVSGLGWANTIKALVIPGMASTFGIFLLRQFFMGIPNELEEAAVLDGCNTGQIFFLIILPLSKSRLIVWNDDFPFPDR